MRLLVVDDDDTLRMTVRTTLESRGYHVEEAEDGEQAIERVTSAGPYDGVVMDVDRRRGRGEEHRRTLVGEPRKLSREQVLGHLAVMGEPVHLQRRQHRTRDAKGRRLRQLFAEQGRRHAPLAQLRVQRGACGVDPRVQSVEASRGVEEVKSDVEEDRGDTHQPDRHGMRLGAPATRAPPGRQQSTVRLRSYRPCSCDSKVAGSIGSGCSSTRPVDAAIAVS